MAHMVNNFKGQPDTEQDMNQDPKIQKKQCSFMFDTVLTDLHHVIRLAKMPQGDIMTPCIR